MPGIEIVLREFEDRFEVFSVEGYSFLPGGSSELLQDLEEVLESDDDDDDGEETQGHPTLMWVGYRLNELYPRESWSIKVERWDGYVYWLRFDKPELAGGESSRPTDPEPQRVSRYSREPII